MRTTLLGGLLDAARHNLARGAERVALFESGRAYLRRAGARRGRRRSAGSFAGERPAPAYEPHRIACARRRRAAAAVGWRDASRPPPDFYALKGVLEALARAARRRARGRAGRAEPFLHPGRAGRGRWSAAPRPAGSASSTRWSAAPGTSTAAAAFELDLAPLVAAPRRSGASTTRT